MAVSYSSCIHTYGASTAAHDGRIHSYSVVNSIIIQLVQTPNVELALLLQHLPRRRPTHCTSYMLDICIVYVLQKANKLCNMMLLLLVRCVCAAAACSLSLFHMRVIFLLNSVDRKKGKRAGSVSSTRLVWPGPGCRKFVCVRFLFTRTQFPVSLMPCEFTQQHYSSA